jgi:hypothetical protein
MVTHLHLEPRLRICGAIPPLLIVWILESGGRIYVGAFGRNLASVAVKMFSYLI